MSYKVTNSSALTHGSLGKQVGLSIITFGLYTLYWMYKTADQLDRGTDANVTPILAVVPFYGFWVVADAAEAVTDQSSVVLFLLFMFFGPAAWFLVQSGINSHASGA